MDNEFLRLQGIKETIMEKEILAIDEREQADKHQEQAYILREEIAALKREAKKIIDSLNII